MSGWQKHWQGYLFSLPKIGRVRQCLDPIMPQKWSGPDPWTRWNWRLRCICLTVSNDVIFLLNAISLNEKEQIFALCPAWNCDILCYWCCSRASVFPFLTLHNSDSRYLTVTATHSTYLPCPKYIVMRTFQYSRLFLSSRFYNHISCRRLWFLCASHRVMVWHWLKQFPRRQLRPICTSSTPTRSSSGIPWRILHVTYSTTVPTSPSLAKRTWMNVILNRTSLFADMICCVATGLDGLEEAWPSMQISRCPSTSS